MTSRRRKVIMNQPMRTDVLALFALVVFTCGCAQAGERRGVDPIYSYRRVHNINTNDLPFTKNKDATIDKPVNELYPSAVLFGKTCGGTIISPTWILSAAHCTLFTNGRYILAGTNNTADDSGVEIRVKNIFIHPRFSVGPYWLNAESYGIKQVGARFDFLLAELHQPLRLDGVKIAAAKLETRERLPKGEAVGYGGFGAENHGETMQEVMHGRDLEILDNSECSSLEEFDAQDMVCTRGRPPRYDSACNGDSGSGLISNGVVVGVASWVENDAFECRNGARVIFSRVSTARDWIHKVTGI